MQEVEVRQELRKWVIDRAQAWDRTDINDDTSLLDEGLLSSLDVVEMILFIESLRGLEVDVDDLEPEAFASVSTIYTAFFDQERSLSG